MNRTLEQKIESLSPYRRALLEQRIEVLYQEQMAAEIKTNGMLTEELGLQQSRIDCLAKLFTELEDRVTKQGQRLAHLEVDYYERGTDRQGMEGQREGSEVRVVEAPEGDQGT